MFIGLTMTIKNSKEKTKILGKNITFMICFFLKKILHVHKSITRRKSVRIVGLNVLFDALMVNDPLIFDIKSPTLLAK